MPLDTTSGVAGIIAFPLTDYYGGTAGQSLVLGDGVPSTERTAYTTPFRALPAAAGPILSPLHGNGKLWTDSSVNNNTGTTQGAALSLVAGKFGNAVSFPGTAGNDIQLATSLVLAGPAPFTVECWTNRNGHTGTGTIVGNGWKVGGSLNWVMAFDTNRPVFYCTTTTAGTIYPATTTTVTDSLWHHLAATYDGTYLRMFLDGTALTSSVVPALAAPSSGLTIIGSNSDGTSGALNGYVDELRFSSACRYTAAFTPPTAAFANDPSTVLLMHFD